MQFTINRNLIAGTNSDGYNIYPIAGCNKFFVCPNTGEIFLKEGEEFQLTPYLFVDSIVSTFPKECVNSVVINQESLFLEGNHFKRWTDSERKHYSLNGEKYFFYPLNGGATPEMLSNPRAIAFYDEIEEKKVLDQSSVLFSMGDDMIIASSSGAELFFSSADKGRSHLMELMTKKHYALEVDSSSFVDIIKEDRALCMSEIEETMIKTIFDFELKGMGDFLGLGQNTLYVIKNKITGKEKNPQPEKNIEKFNMYKLFYAYKKLFS